MAALFVSPQSSADYMAPLLERGAFGVTYERVKALEPVGLSNQMRATFYTFVGRQDLAATLQDIPESQSCFSDDDITRLAPVSSWISDVVADQKVVMFNENHFRIEARVFVASQLEILKSAGFTHIGFEAFQADLADSEELSPVHGFYTQEPTFSALIRQAQAMGFQVFGYESTRAIAEGESAFEVRELTQATNILNQIEQADDDARFVIFAGWDHIAEAAKGPDELRWMAARLKEQSAIDPFTIDLTSCGYAGSDSALANSGMVLADDNNRSRVTGQYRGLVDAQVHLPLPGPDSLKTGYYRQTLGTPVVIADELRHGDEAVLVRAYQHGMNEVAYDQVLLYPGERFPLYLAPGYSYLLVSYSADGSIVGELEHEEPADIQP
ncbi:hypothetical protein CWE12_07245 [Aliidiomarina sedimenti]|uniref:Uncharacterized protein n=1 Tax=Aliidiomarina sedimenti TaxID=1933879 RepID=A0ABY0BYC4_9GAMM|nr:hypothetical protein [Aliidiomarina sedimenti]RUO29760.1 hypothetical protein CWE12_07245 [Aliidiomarina sedimenti]